MPPIDLFAHSLSLQLPDLAATRALGAALAGAVQGKNPGALLLYGDLGAGKTALVRALVGGLKNGKYAEVSSPSFTICNIYCTAPLVHHFDLYRLNQGEIPEDLDESLDHADVLTIVEWSERIRVKDLPGDGILCRLTALSPEGPRTAEFSALGPLARGCLQGMPV